jgi:hypothetical protein
VHTSWTWLVVDFVHACARAHRRSAEIAFGKLDDEEFLELKNYDKNPRRASFGWASNNSIQAELGMDYSRVAESVIRNGEPGLIWLENMRKFGRMGAPADDKDYRVQGANPCVTGDCLILTDRGLRRVDQLMGEDFVAIIDGQPYRTTERGFWSNGVKDTFEVVLRDGARFRATADHKVLTPQGYTPVSSLVAGATELVLGDNRTAFGPGGDDPTEYAAGLERGRAVALADEEEALPVDDECSPSFARGLLRGVFDARAVVCVSCDLRLSGPGIAGVQRLLLSFGVTSALDDNGDNLVVRGESSATFEAKIGFGDADKAAALREALAAANGLIADEFHSVVASVTPSGQHEVYDCTVPVKHCFSCNGVIVHNCVEQSLESYELCVLVETFPAHADSLDDYLKTLRCAIQYAKTITLGATSCPRTNVVLLRNRRIGCSISGIAQFLAKHNIDTLRHWTETGYAAIETLDVELSERFCVPRSIKKTSVKPSGTVSLLAGATPGVHFPESSYYIRRVRVGDDSALLAPLRAAGYDVEECVYGGKGTSVVSIPVSAGEGVRTIDSVSMWEQLSIAAFLQRHWSDNQVSATITFDPATEGPDIVNALNVFQYQLKGISFLPRDTAGGSVYAQSPYEAITREKFEEMSARLEPVKFDNHRSSLPMDGLDNDESAAPDRFCDGDKCIRI